MRAKVVSVGDCKRNVKSDGWNCYLCIDDPSVKGVTVFGDSVEEIQRKLSGVQAGCMVELEVEHKGKFTNLKSISLVEKAKSVPVPVGQQGFGLSEDSPEVEFKPASVDSERDRRKHNAALLLQDTQEVFFRQFKREPKSDGEFELCTAVFKLLGWSN